jgi:2-polyprenyl-3-methyl-5-hydroxy-6-metoxy-1,4-benzoquinol methylase
MNVLNINLNLTKTNPASLIKRAVSKMILGPLKYKNQDDYNAQQYWQDRFKKYGFSLQGAGHEGMTEIENQQRYASAAKFFTELCIEQGIDFQNARVLDIGCGTGYYTKICNEMKVKDYTGIDITNVLLPEIEKKFPLYRFIQKDITEDEIHEKFDLIYMIDVIEHIVTQDKFISAMQNIKKCMTDKSVFIISPLVDRGKKLLFYLRMWTIQDVQQQFPGYNIKTIDNILDDYLLIIKKA